jgi:hypothetical protein
MPQNDGGGSKMDASIVRHCSLEEARQSALEEAVGTGSTIIPIRSVERAHDRAVLIGSIDINLVESIAATGGRTTLTPISVGNLHIYDLKYDHITVDILGYLVMQRPLSIKITESLRDSVEANVAVMLEDQEVSNRINYFGKRCCKRCNSTIATERLSAVPGAELCINCKKIIEGGLYASGRKNGRAN